MTPTKIILERTASLVQLRVYAPETQRGSTVIESVPFRTGNSLPALRKHGADYAKRFAIPFYDRTTGERI